MSLGYTFNQGRPNSGVLPRYPPITGDCDQCDPCTGESNAPACQIPYKSRAQIRVGCPGAEVPALYVDPSKCPAACSAPEIDFSKVVNRQGCVQDQSRAAFFAKWLETSPAPGESYTPYYTSFPQSFATVGRSVTLNPGEPSPAAQFLGFEGDNSLEVVSARPGGGFTNRTFLFSAFGANNSLVIDQDKPINPFFDGRIYGTSCQPCAAEASNPECQVDPIPCFIASQTCEE